MAASKSIFSCAFVSLLLLLLLLLTLLLTQKQNLASDYCRWRVGRGCISGKPAVFRAFQSRKMLRAMKREMEEEVDGGKRRRTVEWDQLRRVPSGPDPLHHSGGSPKKPRTP